MLKNVKTGLWETLLDTLQVQCTSARLHHCPPQWAIANRTIPDEMLHYIHQGSIHFTIGDTQCTARPGQIAWCPPGIAWSAQRESRELIHLTVVHFEAIFPGERRYLEALGYPYLMEPPHRPELENDLARMCRLYQEQDPSFVLKARAVLYGLFNDLFAARAEYPNSIPSDEVVMKSIDFLKAHLHEPLTRQALGRHVGLDPTYLALLFRRYTGHGPIDYLIRLRLEEARKLLATSSLPVAAIARRVGYEDAAYFSRLFHRGHGLSPLGYRKEQRMRRA